MSFNVDWDVNKYKEDHESEDHWELRKAFMLRWKNEYPEERLVCLARVFANMEFMGCRYPTEIMQEVARLSNEVAQSYRKSRKNKLQRTFVSASDAAEDRAKGIKREGGVIINDLSNKSTKISFVPESNKNSEKIVISESDSDVEEVSNSNGVEKQTNDTDKYLYESNDATIEKGDKETSRMLDVDGYLEEMLKVKCLDVKYFSERMLYTNFGQFVLMIRPWASKLCNIQASCQACHINLKSTYENGCFILTMNDKLVAKATGISKAEARSVVETMAWNRLREEVVSIVVKQQWIAHGDARISVSDVAGNSDAEFGTPIESSVATKMMKLMGWKGGGLGVDSQGIAEPIKPHLRMVKRTGLGCNDGKQLRRAAMELMQRYIASDTLDLDLVFSSEFSKEERAQLHQCAQRFGLASRSYGDKDRFLVVRKKLDPFSLVRAVIEKGGNTPKYQVFIPQTLGNRHIRF